MVALTPRRRRDSTQMICSWASGCPSVKRRAYRPIDHDRLQHAVIANIRNVANPPTWTGWSRWDSSPYMYRVSSNSPIFEAFNPPQTLKSGIRYNRDDGDAECETKSASYQRIPTCPLTAATSF